MRLVGFEKRQRDELESYCTQQLPVKLKNCEIQHNFHNKDKLEVKLKSYTQIESTDADFNVPSMNLKTVGSKQISLHQLVDMNQFDRIKTYALKISQSCQLNRVQVQEFQRKAISILSSNWSICAHYRIYW